MTKPLGWRNRWKARLMRSSRFKKVEKDIIIKVNRYLGLLIKDLKFKRRKNIVICDFPEGEGREERERHRSDDESINELMRELDAKVVKFKTIRLGKQVKANKARPIKVELEEEQDKYKILKKAASIISTNMTLKK